MKRGQYSRKLNNLGMSLVEVVVAMAILSIVILPVLRTFVQSARYNATARMRQQTTAAAQTVMENLKAYPVEEIEGQFDDVTCTEDYPATGDYLFEIRGMAYQNVDYDVRVELTPHKKMDGSDDDAYIVNSLIYASYTPQNDAVYCCESGMDIKALNGILQMIADKWNEKESLGEATPALEASPAPTNTPSPHTAEELTASNVIIDKRELIFTVSKPEDKYVIQVSCQYTYTPQNLKYTDPITGTPKPLNESGVYIMDLSDTIDEGKIFNNTDLRSLTVYYYPAYKRYKKDKGVKITNDYIIINNNCPEELDELKCFIYKQRHEGLSNNDILWAEFNYRVHIELKNAGIYDDNLSIQLSDYTYSDAMDDGVDVGINMGGVFVSAKEKRYKGIGYEATKGIDTLSNDDKSALSGVTIEPQQLMYDVTITVYNSGEMNNPEAQPLNSLTGTIVK